MSPSSYRKTSYSEVQTWLRCNREHYYAYGRKLTGKYAGENLERGIMGHSALAEYYRSRQFGNGHGIATTAAYTELARVAAGSQAYSGQKLALEVAGLVSDYFAHYEHERFDVLAVETEYSVGVFDDYRLPVRIDAILRFHSGDYAGRVVALDHKFVKDFYTEDKAKLMPQLRLYKAGLMAENVHVDEIIYNMIRHRTTNDNRDHPALRFQRLEVPQDGTSVRRTIEEHLIAAQRIKAYKELPTLEEWDRKVLRNPSACGMCTFRALCYADLAGEDTSLMREFEYRTKTSREDMAA